MLDLFRVRKETDDYGPLDRLLLYTTDCLGVKPSQAPKKICWRSWESIFAAECRSVVGCRAITSLECLGQGKLPSQSALLPLLQFCIERQIVKSPFFIRDWPSVIIFKSLWSQQQHTPVGDIDPLATTFSLVRRLRFPFFVPNDQVRKSLAQKIGRHVSAIDLHG